jgi:hypothetical protein
MRLAKLSEFVSLYFTPDSAPSLDRLRENIDEIPGGTKLRGHYYVDLDEFEEQTRARKSLEARITQLRQDPRLARLI